MLHVTIKQDKVIVEMSSFFILVAYNWLRTGGVDLEVWKQVWHGQRRWPIRGAVRMTNSLGQ